MGSRRETLTIGALCVAWYTLSSASNVVGKLVLTEFPFPITVTMVQLLSTVVYSVPIFALCNIRRDPEYPLQYYVRVLVPLALAKFFTTMFSQISIWKVPISYAHTVKATTPLWTAALSWAVFGERVSARVRWALVLIVCGVGVASATEARVEAGGLGAALAAALLLSAQQVFTKRVLVRGAAPLRLAARLAALGAALVAPLWMWREARALAAAALGARGAALLALDGALAWLQAGAALALLARVAPLTYAVASAAKRACVVAASLVVLRHPAPPLNVAGMALALLGVLAYQRARLADRAAAPRPLLPV